MVAGYTCQASDDYNRFVRAYRADLRASDAELQHFFYRLHGSAGDRALDSFKTRIANVSMVDSSRDATSYCASTQAAFRDARNVRGNSLERFLATQSLTTTEQFTPCEFATANNFR